MSNTKFNALDEARSFAQGKTREELIALVASYRARGEYARNLAREWKNSDETIAAFDSHSEADELLEVAQELEAFVKDAPPIKRITMGRKRARELAIYLLHNPCLCEESPCSCGSQRPFAIAVMGPHGTNHYNDFQTRDEALLYIAHVRLNWPKLPVIEVTG